MKELMETLTYIAQCVGGEWKENALIDNDTDNDLTDAYNEGVKAMASQVCYKLNAIMLGKIIAHDGDTVTFEKAGDE